MRPLGLLPALSALLWPAMALAHGAPVHERYGWTFDPWITIPLAATLMLYAAGWTRLAHRSRLGLPAIRRGGLLFLAGWSMLAAALVTPLHQAGEHSFAAHMFEHELLMLAAAPFLVLSNALPVILWAFPGRTRRILGAAGTARPIQAPWRLLSDPVVATLVQAAALWLWHTPALFDRALASDGWHVVQHLCFLISALLFWTAVLRRGRNLGVSALCLFATSLVSGALGAMMAFSQSPWYVGYSRLGLAPLGLTPIEDQQLAGMLMWVPGGVVHAAAALAAVAQALKGASAPVFAHDR